MIRFKYIVINLLFLIVSIPLFSQGFDWQYSARLPAETPGLFIGIKAFGNYSLHQGEFDLKENYFLCGTFNNGEGFGYSGGIQTEYWFNSFAAFFINVNYDYQQTIFIAKEEPLPTVDYGVLESEYELNSELTYLSFELGGKLKFASTHFYISPSVRFGFLINNSAKYINRMLSPEDWYWNEKTVENVSTPDAKSYVLIPNLSFGYDLNTGLGTYTSIFVNVGFSATNILETESRKFWMISTGVVIFPFGLIIDE